VKFRFIVFVVLLVVAAGPASSRVTAADPVVKTFMVSMRDGARLATDVYLPSDDKPVPVLLMRTPYGKSWPAASARMLSANGYAVVLQETRGRFASEGANIPFDADGWLEKQDGYDTLEWIAVQSWCKGKIGMYAGSAMGIAQILVACTGTQKLTCLNIGYAIPKLYNMVYVNGLFRQSIIEGWLKENKYAPEALTIWTSHPTYDEYWRKRDATLRFNKVNVPALHVGGWYDLFAQGTIDTFVGFQTKGGNNARGKQKLFMSPYPHTNDEQLSEVAFPHADDLSNALDFTSHYIPGDFPWFEHYLKDVDNGVEQKTPAVTYYVMGDVTDPYAPGNCWRSADTWPPFGTRQTPIYLHSDLTLGMEKNSLESTLAYDYDPNNPVPTIGGPQYFLLAGPRDQRKIESRADILVFTSDPLEKPLEITGRVSARLWASTDAPDTDFFVRLCDVYPDGRSIGICEGGRRVRLRNSLSREESVKPGIPYAFDIDMWSTSIIINKGHRLRIHVTSSCAPGYIPNANTGSYPYSKTMRIAHNTVYLGKSRPSCVILPVPK